MQAIQAALEDISVVGSSTSSEVHWKITRFLNSEAEMLDNRHFEEWYSLLADDVRYYLPIRAWAYENLKRNGNNAGYAGAHFDDDKARMGFRVRKITSGKDHIERPHSLMHHLITNVRVFDTDDPNEYLVKSLFLISRLRHNTQKDIYTGERQDLLRATDTDHGFEIARRTVLLDETVILGGGIGFFF